MVKVRVLKFHIQIPYENIVDPYFCLCSRYVPFWSYAPFKTKFEYLVCKISQKVFKLEPSYSHNENLPMQYTEIFFTCKN